MLHEEIGSITNLKDTDGAILLYHKGAKNCDFKESAIAWAKIHSELKRVYPDTQFQFLSPTYVEKKNPGHTLRQQFQQSITAMPI